MKNNSAKGFTLIELLVVIAIIGILSSVVLASMNSARKKARDARRQSDLKSLQLALEGYYDSNTHYPQQIAQGTVQAGLAGVASGGFIAVLPDDPDTSKDYYYISDAAGTKYCLGAALEANSTSTNTCPSGVTITQAGINYTIGQ